MRGVYMKSKICIYSALIVCLAFNASANYAGINDTVKVDSVEAYAGRTAIVPVFITNSEAVSAIEVTLKFDSLYLIPDSFNFSGGRFDFISETDTQRVVFNDTAHMIDLFFYDFDNPFPPGSGRGFNLYFTVKSNAVGRDLPIDTAFWALPGGGMRKTFFASEAGIQIKPQIVTGNIRVLEAPATLDSIWVDAVVGRPGNGVAVNVYGYNEIEVDSIALALEYTSDDITFNTVNFSGTRSESALNKTVATNLPERQLLITIKFNSLMPMPAGEGVLATLYFDIDINAPEHTVLINSEPYLGFWKTVFHRPSSGGGMTIEPYFHPGQIEIKHTVPVEEDFDNNLLPKEFALAQNYPNPFNPSTRIEFALPRAADVTLTVYNILGEKVKTLVDEHMNPGVHFVIFDGYDDNNNPVASGMYFYRIKAGDFSRSRKMMMLK